MRLVRKPHVRPTSRSSAAHQHFTGSEAAPARRGKRLILLPASVQGQAAAPNPITRPRYPFESPFLCLREAKPRFSPHLTPRMSHVGPRLLAAQSPAGPWPPDADPPPEVPGAHRPLSWLGGPEARQSRGCTGTASLPVLLLPQTSSSVQWAGLGGRAWGTMQAADPEGPAMSLGCRARP